MLQGIGLDELSRRILSAQATKRDFIAQASRLEATVSRADGGIRLHVPDQGEFPIAPLAHRQIGTFTGVPAAYYDKMLKEAPHLLADNINEWMMQMPSDKKRLVRTLAGTNRALLSNSYQRVEHEEIAEVAIPVLQELPGVKIVSAEITSSRLYIHFVVPSIQGDVKVGDTV